MMQRRSLMVGLALSAVAGCALAQDEPSLVGMWTGVLVDGETRLRLRLQIDAGGKAQLESPDQMADFFFPGQVTRSGEEIEIAFPTLPAQFNARLIDDGVLEGLWRQVGEFPLRLSRAVDIVAPAERQPSPRERR